MSGGINVNGIGSLDTKKLIQAHELVAEGVGEIGETLAEIKQLLMEHKDLLTEIKAVLQGD